MLVLGIETSCDETGAAVVDDAGRVLSDVVQSQVELHATYGGIIPELASRDHLRNAGPVVKEALAKAGLSLRDVDAIAVTHRPGLVGALLVGVQLAKGLAWAEGKPLVGVDHLVGHLLAVNLRRSDATPPAPAGPHVALLASGGHTATYRVDGPLARHVTELGATRDDAAGEAFDKVGKLLGLGYPGGPVIDRLATGGDPGAVKLPRPMSGRASRDFSFSGIKTHLAAWVREHGVPQGEQAMKDVCASFQAAVTSVLAEKLIEAAKAEGVGAVTIGGGVAANRELRRRVTEGAAQHGLTATLPELASCTDNAAMIAYAGLQRFVAGERDGWDLVAASRTALPRSTRKGRGHRD
ncbi:MAG: tRNA (adenosine(37)-N6)-threonylcarbamoyltransferase complex transferase subunit TsaD [Myxococcales bacterium]|nr:tRNA (adenosine(37)-N6)-threonylcarbamoyltransferase complex transferase subunit TsaD [Myxococcales bacterium]